MNVTRSIAYGIVGQCKTEASQKPVPVHSILVEALTQWRDRCRYREPDDWVFANEHHRGRHPYWGQAILRGIIRPVAERIGIKKWIGWHTFRHTYSTLLRSVGTEFKVMQELMRHSSLRSTIDIYTQAVTPAKHAAQSPFFPPNRIAKFNPRIKREPAIRLLPRRFKVMNLRVQKGHRIVSILHPRMQGEILAISLTLYRRPRRDLNPCYRRESDQIQNQ
jgi:hypothetical protein